MNQEEEGMLLADGFSDAIIGIARRGPETFMVYDRTKCIEILTEDMPREDAEEYFQFNVEGAWVGGGTPAYVEVFRSPSGKDISDV